MLLICKGPKSFSKYTPVNYKSISLRTSLKETFTDMEKLSKYPKSRDNSIETAIFTATKKKKLNMAVIQIRIYRLIILFTLDFLPGI